MLKVKLYNVETKEKGTVICEELESHGDGFMCCSVENVEGDITPLNYYQFDDGTHIIVPASDFVSAISVT